LAVGKSIPGLPYAWLPSSIPRSNSRDLARRLPSPHFSWKWGREATGGEGKGIPVRVFRCAREKVAEASPGGRSRPGFARARRPPPGAGAPAGERGEQAACHCWCPAPARSARPAVPTGPARRPPLRTPRGRDAVTPRLHPAVSATPSPPWPLREREPSARELSALRRPRPAVCRGGPGRWGRAGPGAAPLGGGGLQGRPGCPVNPSATATAAAVGGGWEVAWAHTCRSVGAAELRGRCGPLLAPPRGAPPCPSPPSSDAAPAPPPPPPPSAGGAQTRAPPARSRHRCREGAAFGAV
jgi:hypothetical protein